jgi:hypothetical protein
MFVLVFARDLLGQVISERVWVKVGVALQLNRGFSIEAARYCK